MKIGRGLWAALLCGALALGGCAVPASGEKRKLGDEGMALGAADVPAPPSPAVAGAVAVGAFDGGPVEKAYPEESAAFRAALPVSLKVAGLLAPGPGAPLSLETRLLDAVGVGRGLDVTVTLKVRYLVRETKTGGVVIDEVATTSHTAGASDSLSGELRRRLATDGAGRKSLAALVSRLNAIQRKAPAAAPAQ